MSGAERGKYLFRIARGIAERARELAVVETLDNGKPIKETRDFDVPTAAAHFFYHAGWADKLQHLGLGADPRPLGVAGQVIPWNFPLLMAAWKIAPALAAGNTVVIKPAETTPLSILVLAEVIADADLPPGVVNIVPGAGDVGSTLVNHPGLDKVAFTGSTPVGRSIQQSPGRHRPEAHPRSAARAPTSSSPMPPWTRRWRGSSTASSSTPARSAAPAPGCWFRSRSPTSCWRSCAPGSRPCGSVTRWTRTPTWARSTPPDSSAHHPRSQAGRERGRGGLVGILPAARARLVLPAHADHRGELVDAGLPREIFGPVLTVLTFRTPDEALAKANNTPYGLSAGVWTEKGSRGDGHGRGSARRGGLGQHLQPLRSGRLVRRLRGVRLRPGGWPVRDGGLPGHRRRADDPRRDRPAAEGRVRR